MLHKAHYDPLDEFEVADLESAPYIEAKPTYRRGHEDGGCLRLPGQVEPLVLAAHLGDRVLLHRRGALRPLRPPLLLQNVLQLFGMG